MNKDRGIIKWLPFDSLVSSKSIVESILYEKRKVKKPILSKEQMEEIEEKLIEAFYEQEKITLKIYKSGYIQSITSTILHIDAIYKKVILTTHDTILFNQIVAISI